MRYSKQLIITIPILLITLFSCTKFTYEKDEIVGNWNIDRYTVDGIDSTVFFEQFNSKILFTNENQIYISCIGNDTNSKSVYAIGEWSLSSRNEIINLKMKTPGADQDLWLKLTPLYPNTQTAWKILSLNRGNFEIRTTVDGIIYKLNLN